MCFTRKCKWRALPVSFCPVSCKNRQEQGISFRSTITGGEVCCSLRNLENKHKKKTCQEEKGSQGDNRVGRTINSFIKGRLNARGVSFKHLIPFYAKKHRCKPQIESYLVFLFHFCLCLKKADLLRKRQKAKSFKWLKIGGKSDKDQFNCASLKRRKLPIQN